MRKQAIGVMMVGMLSSANALAWNRHSHEMLGREAIQYMLRSSNPALRLVGAMIVNAGEGSKAGPGFERKWFLSQEAGAVDYYREVAVRIDGLDGLDAFLEDMDVGVSLPSLSYELMGQALFGAFNHLILMGQQPDPKQHDNYPGSSISADRSLLDSSFGSLLQKASTKELKEQCRDEVKNALRGTNLADIPIIGNAIIDTAASKAYAFCPHVMGEYDHSPALAWYTRNHSTATPADFKDKDLTDIWWHPVDNLASAGADYFGQSDAEQNLRLLAGQVLSKINPSFNSAGGSLWEQLRQTNLNKYLAVMSDSCSKRDCLPLDFERGVSECWYCELMGSGDDSWTRCGDLSERSKDVQRKALSSQLRGFAKECKNSNRCDGLAGNSTKRGMVSLSAERGWAECSQPNDTIAIPASCQKKWKITKDGQEQGGLCLDLATRYFEIPLDEWPLQCQTPYGESCYDDLVWLVKKFVDPPAPRGHLLHLGRVLHGLADAAQAGHVIGQLLDPEHIGMEEYLDWRIINEFENPKLIEQTQDDGHVVVVPSYGFAAGAPDKDGKAVISGIYDLNAYFDLHAVETELQGRWADYFNANPVPSMEDVSEKIATRTLEMVKKHRDAQAYFFTKGASADKDNLRKPADAVTKQYFTHSLVAEIVGLVAASRQYVGSKDRWDSLVNKVSWTNLDFGLLSSEQAKLPSIETGKAIGDSAKLSPFVEAGYQSKKFENLCYVTTVDWCSSVPMAGKPCRLPDCASFGCDIKNPAACPVKACQYHLPEPPFEIVNSDFSSTTSLGQEIKLSTLFGSDSLPSASHPFCQLTTTKQAGDAVKQVGKCWKYMPEPPTFQPRIHVRLGQNNRGEFESDMIHVTSPFGIWNSIAPTVYHRDGLTKSTGKEIILPSEVREVAVWCTGSNIHDAQDVLGSATTGADLAVKTNTICNAEISLDEGIEHLQCGEIEKCLLSGGALNGEGRCVHPKVASGGVVADLIKDDLKVISQPDLNLDWGDFKFDTPIPSIGPPTPGLKPPRPPFSGVIDGRTVDPTAGSRMSVADLAREFSTPEEKLAKVMEGAHGKEIQLITPSPYGEASLVWREDNGLTSIVTINAKGGIVAWQGNRDPI